MKDNTRG